MVLKQPTQRIPDLCFEESFPRTQLPHSITTPLKSPYTSPHTAFWTAALARPPRTAAISGATQPHRSPQSSDSQIRLFNSPRVLHCRPLDRILRRAAIMSRHSIGIPRIQLGPSHGMLHAQCKVAAPFVLLIVSAQRAEKVQIVLGLHLRGVQLV